MKTGNLEEGRLFKESLHTGVVVDQHKQEGTHCIQLDGFVAVVCLFVVFFGLSHNLIRVQVAVRAN